MRALIADDEPIARQILREHLEDLSEMAVVGEAASGAQAVRQIEKLHPDVVFLDLQMPELDGFAVVRSLKGARAPAVIFVTAYGHRAVDAYNIGAVDYLLKPVRRERLEAALAKARAHLDAQRRPSPPPLPPPRKIVGRLGSDFHMLAPDDVVAFVADGDSVYVLAAGNRRYLSNHTLKALDSRLPRPQFRRIHRKTIINTNHIRRISPLSSKRWLLQMSSGLEVVVSKRMAGAIRDETNW